MSSFIQISDLHLFKDKDMLLNGANPYSNLEKVINEIKVLEESYEFLVISGDCSQDTSIESYVHLRKFLSGLKVKYYLFPGNHDDVKKMNEVFSSTWKNGEVNYLFRYGSQSFYVIDSTCPPQEYAKFADQQLMWLEEELKKNPHSPSIVFMHHHPVKMQSKWIDDIAFKKKENEKFNDLIKHAGNVKAVIFGHVHQFFEEEIDGKQYFSAPATVYQVVSRADEFQVEKITPGFRKYFFNGESVKSEVVWLS